MSLEHSTCVTLRTKVGIRDTFLKKVLHWCERQEYCYMVSEQKEGPESQHLHIQTWSTEGNRRNTLEVAFSRFLKAEYTKDEYYLSWARVLKIAFSDWWQSYLQKDNSELLYDNIPQDTSEFYPSEEDQLKIIERSKAGDPQFYDWWKLWNEKNGEAEAKHDEVAEFLFDQIYTHESKHKVIWKQRDRISKCESLFCYINHNNGHLDSNNKKMMFLSEKNQQKFIIRPMCRERETRCHEVSVMENQGSHDKKSEELEDPTFWSDDSGSDEEIEIEL